MLDVSNKTIEGTDWKTYRDIYFEHSDSCPSRRNRIVHAEKNEEMPVRESNIEMAVCSYVMDKDDNLLITKRPGWLQIFPQAWVMPGGSVNLGEELELSCVREIEEEVGFTIEPKIENDFSCSEYFLTSPLKIPPGETTAPTHKPKVDFYPYYLYESVTKNIESVE